MHAVIVEQDAAVGRRDRKKQQTRAALITAALGLVAERGLDAVTVEEISDAAGVSSRTFFNYFACKDEALVGDHSLDADRLVARLDAVPAGVPAVAAIHHVLRQIFEEVQADQELWFLRMRVVDENPVLLARLVASGVEAERVMIAAIAARSGVDPETHSYPVLVAAVCGAAGRAAMTHWAASHGAVPLTELVDDAFAQLTAGLPDPHPVTA